MKNKETVFKIFLVIYAGLLIFHATKIDWDILSIIGLAFGLLLAYFAHAKNGSVTILFLAVHMTIEWAHHIKFGFAYTTGEFFLHGIHAIFDGVFLISEWKSHSHGAVKAILAGIAIAVLALMIFGGNGTEVTVFPFESLVIGGILGCVATHLLEKKTKKLAD